MNFISVSNNPTKSGGGLWADIVSAHSSSALPLFWSLHKNSIVDKFFEGWDYIRAEEDARYSRRAENPREVTALSVSNCGSFLFSGFSDGWLVKNSVETARLVKKFKYNDLPTANNNPVLSLFCDSKNSFLIVVKENLIEKIDFYVGIRLMTFEMKKNNFRELDFKLTDIESLNPKTKSNNFETVDFKIAENNPNFFSQTLAELETKKESCKSNFAECKIKMDQLNNLLVIVTESDSVKVVNTENMTKVRDFALKNQSAVSCLELAIHSKKILIATKDRRLGVYDLFSSTLLSQFELDGVMAAMAIRESCHLLAGAYQKQKSVSLWKVQNLDWKVGDTLQMKFESPLKDLKIDKRELYFIQKEETLQKKLATQTTLQEELLEKIKSQLNENKFDEEAGTGYDLKLTDLPQEKWSNLRYLQKVITRNQIKEANIQKENLEDLPFFLDAEDSTFGMNHDEARGKFFGQIKKTQIIRKRDENEFLDQENESLESLLARIPTQPEAVTPQNKLLPICEKLLESLKEKNSFAIDHFLRKEAMMSPENCMKLLTFFSLIFEHHQADFDFKVTLAQVFLESGVHHLIGEGGEGREGEKISERLGVLRDCVGWKTQEIEREFFCIKSELQRVAND